MVASILDRPVGRLIDVRGLLRDEALYAEGPVRLAKQPADDMVRDREEVYAILKRLLHHVLQEMQPVLIVEVSTEGRRSCFHNLQIDVQRSKLGDVIATRCHHCQGMSQSFDSQTITGLHVRFQDRRFVLLQNVEGTKENERYIEWRQSLKSTFPIDRPDLEDEPQPALTVAA
jgi:hypothetical protein